MQKEGSMVLTISDKEFVRMKTTALDGNKQEAVRLIREFVKRLELQIIF
jgi:hypothetical protein